MLPPTKAHQRRPRPSTLLTDGLEVWRRFPPLDNFAYSIFKSGYFMKSTPILEMYINDAIYIFKLTSYSSYQIFTGITLLSM